MKKAVVFNLGCKVNQYECDVLVSGLKELGYQTSEKLEPADVYIVNTCAVTAEAERKSRQILSRIRAQNPDAYIAVCGCASQKNIDFFVNSGVQYVSGVAGKNRLIDFLGKTYHKIEDLPFRYEDSQKYPSGSRTRAYVKIQDGCSNFCSYCIIPYLRGAPRSKKVSDAAKEIIELSKTTDEIVITGINLSYYGMENGETLAQLIRAIKDIDVRIRLGSFYVEGINAELLDALFSLKNFCPHFHLSLQHGDNKVLKDMNRHYTVEDYRTRVEQIRSYDKRTAITTDIIAGYPTETDEAFCNTLEFVNIVSFADIHVFPYSRREGTMAASLPLLLPQVIKDRVKILRGARDNLRKAYLTSMIDVPQEVIFEEKRGDYSVGYSQYYIRCYADLKHPIKHGIILPEELYKDGVKGN